MLLNPSNDKPSLLDKARGGFSAVPVLDWRRKSVIEITDKVEGTTTEVKRQPARYAPTPRHPNQNFVWDTERHVDEGRGNHADSVE